MRKTLFACALLLVTGLVACEKGWPAFGHGPYWLSDGGTLEFYCHRGKESGTLIVSSGDNGATAHIQFNGREALLSHHQGGWFFEDHYRNDAIEMTLDPEAKVSGLVDEYLSCAI